MLASKGIVRASRGFLAGNRMFCIFQRQAELKKHLKAKKKKTKKEKICLLPGFDSA